jgi:hypothetical protein
MQAIHYSLHFYLLSAAQACMCIRASNFYHNGIKVSKANKASHNAYSATHRLFFINVGMLLYLNFMAEESILLHLIQYS